MSRILLIDLTQETWAEFPWFGPMGGKLLANRILLDHLNGTEAAFSDENWLILSTGPLTGTGIPGSVRFEITAISPKTGLPVSSNCGGNFGLHLKQAGWDAVILKGSCQSHRWLQIHNDTVLFHDASALWGMGTSRCKTALSTQHPSPFSSLCIGPAGEDLLPSATVICGDRAVGRAGLGAVLGWKKVKAITVFGSNTIPVFDRKCLNLEIQKLVQEIRSNPLTSDPQKINGCPGCPIRCKKPEGEEIHFLNELGLDSMDAQNHGNWLRQRGISFEDMPKNPSGKRKNKVYHSVLRSMDLQDWDEVFQEYQALTEAISALGLCIFALIPCLDTRAGNSYFPLSDALPRLVQWATGRYLSSDDLLAFGKELLGTTQTLQNRFQKRNRKTE